MIKCPECGSVQFRKEKVGFSCDRCYTAFSALEKAEVTLDTKVTLSELESLRKENDRLRARLNQLETELAIYKPQTVESQGWQVTFPEGVTQPNMIITTVGTTSGNSFYIKGPGFQFL